MKVDKKIVLLVTLALFLAMTGCTRQASTAAVSSPDANGEAPFPFETEGALGENIANFGTQTAIAQTPQVEIATATAEVVSPTDAGEQTGQTGETGGGQEAQPTAEVPSTEAGGGVVSAIATPVVERPATYSLQRGEWPLCIARRFDLDISSFFSANNLNMNSKPSAGTVLTIPASGNWNTASYGARSLVQHPTTYSVSAGETVYTIACKFGDLAPEVIMQVNNLASPSDLQAGATITIP